MHHATEKMPTCPKCGEELFENDDVSGKLFCYACRTSYTETVIAQHWTGNGYDVTVPADELPIYPKRNRTSSKSPGKRKYKIDEDGRTGKWGKLSDGGVEVPEGDFVGRHISEFSLTALGCGICALGVSIIPYLNIIVYVPAIVGIILGIMSVKKAKESPTTGLYTSAVAAIICSVVAVLMSLVINASVSSLAGSFMDFLNGSVSQMTKTTENITENAGGSSNQSNGQSNAEMR